VVARSFLPLHGIFSALYIFRDNNNFSSQFNVSRVVIFRKQSACRYGVLGLPPQHTVSEPRNNTRASTRQMKKYHATVLQNQGTTAPACSSPTVASRHKHSKSIRCSSKPAIRQAAAAPISRPPTWQQTALSMLNGVPSATDASRWAEKLLLDPNAMDRSPFVPRP